MVLKQEEEVMPGVIFYMFFVPTFLLIYYLFRTLGAFTMIIDSFYDTKEIIQNVAITYNLVYLSVSILLTSMVSALVVFMVYDLYGKYRRSN